MDLSALLRGIGRRVAEIRTVRGLTQEQLAELLGVSVIYVQGVERGAKRLALKQLVRFGAVLEVEVIEFFKEPQSMERRTGRPRRLG